LRNNQLGIGKFSNDSAHAPPNLNSRPQSSMTVGHLVSARFVGVWAHQNRDLLPMFANRGDQGGMLSGEFSEPIRDERGFD
jgi:hypothetical protein